MALTLPRCFECHRDLTANRGVLVRALILTIAMECERLSAALWEWHGDDRNYHRDPNPNERSRGSGERRASTCVVACRPMCHCEKSMSLAPDQWQEVVPYLDQVLSLQEGERRAWLESFRVQRPDLAGLLQELLEEQRAAEHEKFLEETPIQGALGTSLEGQKIGVYTLVSLIGQGGMGEVWLAEQKEPVHRRVALKPQPACTCPLRRRAWPDCSSTSACRGAPDPAPGAGPPDSGQRLVCRGQVRAGRKALPTGSGSPTPGFGS